MTTYTFTLKLSVSQKGDFPKAEVAKQVVSESKIISNCKVQGYQVSYTLKTGMSVNKSVEKLREALTIITNFLNTQDFKSCCQEDGTEGIEDIYNIAGVPVICCPDCFKLRSDEVSVNQHEKSQKKENIIGGFVGALIGSLLGVVAIVILGQLGYVAVISGLILAVCTLKGYELLGGKLSKVGIVISVLIMIVMVYFGSRLDWSISVANYYEDVDILYAFQILPQLFAEGYLEASAFYESLFLVYIFTAIGAIPTIINMIRDGKLKTESYKMTGSREN